MRTITLLIVLVSACLGQPSRADRFSPNSYEFSGVIPYGAVSGNVTTNGSGVMTVNTAAAHGLVAGDLAVLTACAEAGLNATWTIATVPLATRFTVNATAVNNANSASCVLQSFKTLTTRTFYVSGIVIVNSNTSAKTVNVRDRSTNCNAGPCRVGIPLNMSVAASTPYVVSLPYIIATSGLYISGSVGTDLEYRIVGSY